MSRQVDIKALVSHLVRGDGADRCRICMGDTSEGQVHLEDTVMMDGDNPVTLAELLHMITGIEVQLDDCLPLGLCPTCTLSALEAAEFRTFIRNSSLKWYSFIELLNKLSTTESESSDKIIALLTDSRIFIRTEFKENCLELPEPENVKKVISKLEKKYETPNLKTKKYKLMKSKRRKHVHTKSNYRTRDEKNMDQKYQCPFCGKQFKYAQNLCEHLKDSSNFQRACYICAKIMTRDELEEHLKNLHNRKPYACKKCPAMFHSYKKFKEHLTIAHSSGSCTCGECGRNFQSPHAFYAHLSIHTPKKCPSCDEPFRNQKCYLYHVKRCCNLDKQRSDVHQTKTKATITVKRQNRDVQVGMRGSTDCECVCDYCNKKFAGKKFVAAHIQIVHLKNTHMPCIYCGKLLAAAHMSTHLKNHESTQSFKCDQCGLVLKTKLGYSQHLRLHTGERPYACKFCGQSFSASSRRSEHIRKFHKDTDITLKHSCDYCSARFRLPYRLKRHVNSVHGEGKEQLLQFECNMCQQKFNSCRGLLHHSRKHKDTNDVLEKIPAYSKNLV